MKRLLVSLGFVACSAIGLAQEPVLAFDGELYFIPATMTKGGEAFLLSVNNYSDNKGFTIYDGDFNIVRDYKDPAEGQPYQQRVITYTRVCDPGSETGSGSDSGSGAVTRSATDDWTVLDDQTFDYTTSTSVLSFELYSDNNDYHSRNLYVTQTLFDDDEEFEYVRTRKTIIPISIKYSDYVKEHSIGNEQTYTPFYGDEVLDSIMKANGADDYTYFWDEGSGKRLLRLYKHEYYGGLFREGVEVVTLDGTVKAFIPGITSISSAYYFRGKCYVQGYSSDNSRVLYLLGNDATGIRELSRSKADCIVRRVGDNLVIDNDSDSQQTIVMSTMDGRVVRSLTARQGTNLIHLNGLQCGVYNITLYRQSMPMKSTKIIVR